MADDDIKTDDTQVDDNIDDEIQDGNEDENEIKSEEDILDFVKDEIDKTKTKEDNADDSADDDIDVLPELKGTGIPDEFTDAARESGMSDEDIIALSNKYTDEQLIEMIPTLSEEDDVKDDSTDKDDKTNEDDDITKGIDEDTIKQLTEKITKDLESKLGITLDKINQFESFQKEQSDKQTAETVSKIFDEASKEFPVFGKTEELPKFPSGRMKGQVISTSPEMKARMEVIKYADAFMSTGASVDDAMRNALATYKGMNLEKETQRKVIRDLKRSEKSLSGIRVGKETNKKFTNINEEMLAFIDEQKKNAGA